MYASMFILYDCYLAAIFSKYLLFVEVVKIVMMGFIPGWQTEQTHNWHKLT